MGRVGTHRTNLRYGMGRNGTEWDRTGKRSETQKPLGGNARVGSTHTFGTTVTHRLKVRGSSHAEPTGVSAGPKEVTPRPRFPSKRLTRGEPARCCHCAPRDVTTNRTVQLSHPIEDVRCRRSAIGEADAEAASWCQLASASVGFGGPSGAASNQPQEVRPNQRRECSGRLDVCLTDDVAPLPAGLFGDRRDPLRAPSSCCTCCDRRPRANQERPPKRRSRSRHRQSTRPSSHCLHSRRHRPPTKQPRIVDVATGQITPLQFPDGYTVQWLLSDGSIYVTNSQGASLVLDQSASPPPIATLDVPPAAYAQGGVLGKRCSLGPRQTGHTPTTSRPANSAGTRLSRMSFAHSPGRSTYRRSRTSRAQAMPKRSGS